MQMNGINSGQKVNSAVVSQNEKNSTGYEKGQVIEGLISKVSDEISINFSGRELKFSNQTVQNAKEGEVRKFQIMDISRGSIVLKEVGRTTGNSENISGKTSSTLVQIDFLAFMDNKNVKAEEIDDEEDLNDVSNRMTEEDYEALSNEGFTLEEFNLERLTRALERIKNQRYQKQESLESQTKQKKEVRESVKEVARAMISDSAAADKITAILVELDLPVTEENVKNLLRTMDYAKEASKLSDSSCIYLIDNELAPTAENIYKAVHSGAKVVNSFSQDVWNELKDEVTNIILESGIEVNERSVTTARWLMDKELPITGDNIKYKKLLDEINDVDFITVAMQAAASQISTGTEMAFFPFREDTNNIATNLVNDVNNITEAGILRAFYNRQVKDSISAKESEEADVELNLKDFIKAQEEIKEGLSKETETVIANDAQNPIEVITAKRQLEEIRLKLTTESCNKMLLKGISVDTESLSRVVEELKTIEDSYYKNLLEEVGANGEDKLALLRETSQSLKDLQEAPSIILGKTFATREVETIQNLSSVGETVSKQLKSAGESYEALMTKPRSDLGDSIQKAFAHVDEMLEQMNLEKTNANERAVRILGYNNIEINNENIQSMKAYDAKVNDLFENLSPSVTAMLIKEGVNPLQMPIDDLNQLAMRIKEDKDISTDESFSEYLVRLEDNKEISKEERSSYVGIYRLLKQVEKSDGAAVGALVKAGQEVTLNNLLSAIRTKNHGSLDTVIDDKFGAMVSINKSGESITDQINSAYDKENSGDADKSEESLYQNNLISKLYRNLTPNKLKQAVQQFGDSIGDISLERLKEQIDQTNMLENGDIVTKNRLEQIRNLSRDSEEEQQFLKEYGLPNSINNLLAAKEMGSNGASLFLNLAELTHNLSMKQPGDTSKEAKGVPNNIQSGLLGEFLESLDNKEKLTETFGKLKTNIEDGFDDIMSNQEVSAKDLQLMSNISNLLKLSMNLNNKEYYNIPMETSNGVVAMNLTVVHEGNSKGKVCIKIPDEVLGVIRTELSVDNKEVKCFITAQSKIAVDILKQREDELVKKFELIGLQLNEIYYETSLSEGSNFIFKNGSIFKSNLNEKDIKLQEEVLENSTSTNELYKAAKTVILHIGQPKA